MKFGLLMNVIILYHYLQFKGIGISLQNKGVNAQYVKFLESIF